MKELNEKIEGRGEVKGITFTQIEKSKKAYIYKSNEGYYEVFKRKTFNDNEIYPSSKAFGIYAWTYPTFEKALQKFQDISG